MQQVIKYQSDDGTLHETEIAALRSDAKHWKNKATSLAEQLAQKQPIVSREFSSEPRSSYGSSGGGGHD